ncbi:MAG: MMPL family transporter [Sporolactobacillus sp.]
MRKMIKWRWLLLGVWIIVAVGLNHFMPDLTQLAIDKGQPQIPSGYSSFVGNNLLNEKNNVSSHSKETNLLVVFHRGKALTNTQLTAIHRGVDQLKSDKAFLHIKNITDYFDNKNLKDEMVSKDGTTVLVSLTVDKTGTSINTIRSGIDKSLSAVPVQHDLTGGDLINNDMIATSQAGTKKTEYFTFAAIFLILFLVFRSPVAPVVSLFSIALTFLCAQGIVTQLADQLNFPYSSSTSTFLILVLFGIGTDYTLLLMMRFREELRMKSTQDAIVSTYHTAGKTVFLSSLTVLIGFSVLGFAKFSIYQAVSAVAIAVAVLLLELTTLLPCLMGLLGPRLFWPMTSHAGHSHNRLWENLSSFSVRKPVVCLLAILIATVPIIFLYKTDLSYDNLHEVAPSYDSVKGVNISSNAFGPGKLFPVNVLIQSHSSMDSGEALAAIDKLDDDLTKVSGVQSVYSATRPKGSKLDNLYLNHQTKQLSDGLNSTQSGIEKIKGSLQSAAAQMQSSSADSGSLEHLQAGMNALATGIVSLQNSAGQLSSGAGSLQQGANSLSSNLDALETACQSLTGGMSGSAPGAQQITQGIQSVSANLSKLQDMLNQMNAGSAAMNTAMQTVKTDLGNVGTTMASVGRPTTDIGDKVGELGKLLSPTDPQYASEMQLISVIGTDTKTIGSSLSQVNSSLAGVQSALDSLTNTTSSQSLSAAQTGLDAMSNGLAALETASSQLSTGLISASDGQAKMTAAIAQLDSGAKQLDSGLATMASGQEKLTSGAAQLSSAASTIQSGQTKLINGIGSLSGQLTELTAGLNDASKGLENVSGGIESAEMYLNALSASQESHSIFYIPDDQLKSADFQKSLDAYMSNNRHIAEITVYLSIDPYSARAIDVVGDIGHVLSVDLQSGFLKGATFGMTGVSSQNRDLSLVSGSDLFRSTILMLIGIMILLFFITRSMLMPMFILAALSISYYTAYTLTQLLFGYVFHVGSLTWTAPFFSFIMLIPLGVDYSIFLVMRFREGGRLETSQAMIDAAAGTGSVILSAAIILSATFAALYPSQITSQAELATTVIIGLALLVFIFMPLFLPACVSLREKLQAWGKSRQKHMDELKLD